jgi:hypothetical protein
MSTDPLHLSDDEYAEWFARLPDEDPADFCDLTAAVPIRWVEGVGWGTAAAGGEAQPARGLGFRAMARQPRQ